MRRSRTCCTRASAYKRASAVGNSSADCRVNGSFAQHSRSAAPAGASARQTSSGPSPRMRARVPRSSRARCTAAPGYTHTTRSVAFGTLSAAESISTRTNPAGPTTTRSRCALVPPDLRGTHAYARARAETHTCMHRHTRAQTLSPEYSNAFIYPHQTCRGHCSQGSTGFWHAHACEQGVGCVRAYMHASAWMCGRP
jgi:hypothetical protein